MGEWYKRFQCGKRQAAQFCSCGIFQWLRHLNRKYRGKPSTSMSTAWLFTDLNSRKTKSLINELYNGSARVINLCTFPSQPTQNKQVHYQGIIFITCFLHEFSFSWYFHCLPAWKSVKCFTFPFSLSECAWVMTSLAHFAILDVY